MCWWTYSDNFKDVHCNTTTTIAVNEGWMKVDERWIDGDEGWMGVIASWKLG